MTYLEFLLQSKRIVDIHQHHMGVFTLIVKEDIGERYQVIRLHPAMLIPPDYYIKSYPNYAEAKVAYDVVFKREDKKNPLPELTDSAEILASLRLKEYNRIFN